MLRRLHGDVLHVRVDDINIIPHGAAVGVAAAHRTGNPHVIAMTSMGRGTHLARSGRFDEARVSLQEAIDRFAETGDERLVEACRSELAHAVRRSGQLDEALALYDRAAVAAPRDPAGPKTGGLRAARWGELAEARPRLEEALRRDPRDAEAWHALGLVRLHGGDLPGARVAYESGLLADPSALANRIGLATVALREKNPAAALAEYDRVLAARPEFTPGYLGRAWSLMALGRLVDARAAIDEARRRGADARALERQSRLLVALTRRAGEPSPSAVTPKKVHGLEGL